MDGQGVVACVPFGPFTSAWVVGEVEEGFGERIFFEIDGFFGAFGKNPGEVDDFAVIFAVGDGDVEIEEARDRFDLFGGIIDTGCFGGFRKQWSGGLLHHFDGNVVVGFGGALNTTDKHFDIFVT